MAHSANRTAPIFSSPRRLDPVEAAIQARDAGMQAIVFMDVFEMSNGTAWLVNRVVPDFQTFGGLILNMVYGGMNPRAVKTAIQYGAGAKYINLYEDLDKVRLPVDKYR